MNTIFRVSPERLFLELTFYSESVLVENLGIGLGLDVNTLYEKSAEYLLQRGQVAQAVKFCKFVKVMKSITVFIFDDHLFRFDMKFRKISKH